MKLLGVVLAAVVICFVAGTSAQAQVAYVTYYPAEAVYCPPPVAVTAYYAPAVVYEPAVVVRTRYRPLLGGTVTRVRPVYARRWWW